MIAHRVALAAKHMSDGQDFVVRSRNGKAEESSVVWGDVSL